MELLEVDRKEDFRRLAMPAGTKRGVAKPLFPVRSREISTTPQPACTKRVPMNVARAQRYAIVVRIMYCLGRVAGENMENGLATPQETCASYRRS